MKKDKKFIITDDIIEECLEESLDKSTTKVQKKNRYVITK